MSSSRPRRMLLAVALTVGVGLTAVAPSPVAAAPGVTVPTTTPPSVPPPTIPSTTSPSQSAPAPDDPFEAGDVIDWAKDHVVQIIIVVGLLLLVATWKYISRSTTSRMKF